jgi:hypothetical protein
VGDIETDFPFVGSSSQRVLSTGRYATVTKTGIVSTAFSRHALTFIGSIITIPQVCDSLFSLNEALIHFTAKALELMVVDALLLADPFMNISERIDQPERFTFLNDGILEEVERSTDEVDICSAFA